MTTFHVRTHTRISKVAIDAIRWRAWLDEDISIRVDLARAGAAETGLTDQELHDRLPQALQRYADRVLRGHASVLDQVAGWNTPIVLSGVDFQSSKWDT